MLRIVRPQFGSPTPARLSAKRVRRAGPTPTTRTCARRLSSSICPITRRAGRSTSARRHARSCAGRCASSPSAAARSSPAVAGRRARTRRWTPSSACCASAGATARSTSRSDPAFRGLVHEAIPALAERGDAWLTVARDDDGIQGVLVSVTQNGYAMALMVAMTSDAVYRPFSLGKHLFDVGLAEAVRRGCVTTTSCGSAATRKASGTRRRASSRARWSAAACIGKQVATALGAARSRSTEAALSAHRRRYYMTRHRKYYSRQSQASRGATTRVMTNGRLVDALSNGEPGPGVQRGQLTLPQVLAIGILAAGPLLRLRDVPDPHVAPRPGSRGKSDRGAHRADVGHPGPDPGQDR